METVAASCVRVVATFAVAAILLYVFRIEGARRALTRRKPLPIFGALRATRPEFTLLVAESRVLPQEHGTWWWVVRSFLIDTKCNPLRTMSDRPAMP